MARTKIKIDRDESPTTEDMGTVTWHEMATPPNMPELLKSIIEWAVELLRADAPRDRGIDLRGQGTQQ